MVDLSKAQELADKHNVPVISIIEAMEWEEDKLLSMLQSDLDKVNLDISKNPVPLYDLEILPGKIIRRLVHYGMRRTIKHVIENLQNIEKR